jgi:hypothetical protein
MLSKLVSKQVINHGLRLTTRAASAAAQHKPKVERKPEVKCHKVGLSLTINKYWKIYFVFFSYFL